MSEKSPQSMLKWIGKTCHMSYLNNRPDPRDPRRSGIDMI